MIRRLLALALLAVPIGCATFEGYRHFEAGNTALDRGDATSAIASFERAAALVPEGSEIQNHLGVAYLAAGREADAAAAFERAMALDCDNQAAQANLHALRAQRGGATDGERVPEPAQAAERR